MPRQGPFEDCGVTVLDGNHGHSDGAARYQILLDTVRQNFASVVWTHKIQEKQADIYSERYRRVEMVNILAASLTSCGVVTTIFWEGLIPKIIAAVLSFVTLVIASYYKSFGVKERALESKAAANRFIGIRNDMLQVIADLHMMAEPVEVINERFSCIMERLNKLYVDAPSTTDAAVARAADALNGKAEYSYTEDEIDRLLPPSLRGPIRER